MEFVVELSRVITVAWERVTVNARTYAEAEGIALGLGRKWEASRVEEAIHVDNIIKMSVD